MLDVLKQRTYKDGLANAFFRGATKSLGGSLGAPMKGKPTGESGRDVCSKIRWANDNSPFRFVWNMRISEEGATIHLDVMDDSDELLHTFVGGYAMGQISGGAGLHRACRESTHLLVQAVDELNDAVASHFGVEKSALPWIQE